MDLSGRSHRGLHYHGPCYRCMALPASREERQPVLCLDSTTALTAISIKLFLNCLGCFHCIPNTPSGIFVPRYINELMLSGAGRWQHPWNFTCAHKNLETSENVDTSVLRSSWNLFPFHRLPKHPCLGVLCDHSIFLLWASCRRECACWGLDVNTSQTQPHPFATHRPFAELTVCCHAPWKPATERLSHLTFLFGWNLVSWKRCPSQVIRILQSVF